MKFILYTLADITPTGARRGEGLPYHQEQNYMTVIQTISLRANPSGVRVTSQEQSLGNMQFGKKYKGKQSIWCMEFDIEYEDATSVELLQNDFDLVPFTKDLDETVSFEKTIFLTNNTDYTNIFFEQLDK